MAGKTTLRAQVDAFENILLSQEGYLNQVAALWDSPKHGARVQAESACTRMWIDAMRDGVRTMKLLLEYEDDFRALVVAKRLAQANEVAA